MKEIKCKQIVKTTIIVLIAILITLYYLYNYWSDGMYSTFGFNKGLNIFYVINKVGIFLPFTLIIAFLSSNFTNLIFYQNKYNDFQKYVITRVGYKKRLIYEIKTVLKTSFIIRLLLHIIMIAIIQLFYSNISFIEYSDLSYYPEGAVALFTNSKISLILYIIYSSIGFSIFSVFMYSLIYYIKNKYIYKVSGVILFVLLVIISALIGNQLYTLTSNIKFANPILQALATTSLICPGLEVFSSITSIFETHIYFWYTCVCFIVYSLILLVIRYRREHKNG